MLKKGLDEWWTKKLRSEWDAIVKSSYNRDYRIIYGGKETTTCTYLYKRSKNKRLKEIWAKMRCGNFGRAKKRAIRTGSADCAKVSRRP